MELRKEKEKLMSGKSLLYTAELDGLFAKRSTPRRLLFALLTSDYIRPLQA
jgi:hypothetical protein